MEYKNKTKWKQQNSYGFTDIEKKKFITIRESNGENINRLQGCILLLCLFTLSTQYIVQNVRLDKVQAKSKMAGKNINNLRYADDNTLMAESKEEK